jgi:hypothetical protein
MLAVGLPQLGQVGCSPEQVRLLCPPSPHTVHATRAILAPRSKGVGERKTPKRFTAAGPRSPSSARGRVRSGQADLEPIDFIDATRRTGVSTAPVADMYDTYQRSSEALRTPGHPENSTKTNWGRRTRTASATRFQRLECCPVIPARLPALEMS